MTYIISVLFAAAGANATAVSFPKNFRWCVATAAHQIEGANFHSDWWSFEQEPGRIKKGETSAVADDHWNRVDEDIRLMKDLNATDYRLSIEWAKIEPRPGEIDSAAVAHYRDEIKALLAAGIQPIVTLQHFTFPAWVRDRGGFEWSGLPEAFARFTTLVYGDVAPEARDWVTINEPMVSILAGYHEGVVPPAQKREPKDWAPVIGGVLRAHAAAYHALHDSAAKANRQVRVGMAHHLRTIDPYYDWLPTDRWLAEYADKAFNWSIPEAMETGVLRFELPPFLNWTESIPDLAGTQDFMGINYYSGDLVHLSLTDGFQLEKADLPRNDLNWPIYPEGFQRVLRAAAERHPGKPILITENGIADSTDRLRPKFLHDHLTVLSNAISEGISIEGYCHWSLLDNFEWIDGYAPRFGLFEVDYITLARRPRASAKLFSAIAKENRLPDLRESEQLTRVAGESEEL